MSIEVEGILAEMENISVKCIGGIDFSVGRISGKQIVVAKSGVGKVNAAMCAQAMIISFPVAAVINLGVAGAISSELNIGDAVVSRDLVQHDMRTSAFGGYALGQVPGLDVVAFSADAALVKSALLACETVFSGSSHNAYCGTIATGDQFVDSALTKQEIRDNFGAFCVEMEGAAIAQVCYLNHIPFVAIRAISDKADGSAETDFVTFAIKAAAHSAKIAAKMIDCYISFNSQPAAHLK